MALQRTRRPRFRLGRSLRSLGSPLNARPLGRVSELARLLLAGASIVFSTGLAPAGSSDQRLRASLPVTRLNRECGFEVSIPRGWRIEMLNSQCWFGLKPAEWDRTTETSDIDLPDYPMHLGVRGTPLHQVAIERGFRLENEAWVLRDGSVDRGAKPDVLEGVGWRALRHRGWPNNRTFKRGGNAGAAHHTEVILGNSARSATFYVVDDDVDSDLFLNIVKSFRFLGRSGRRK